MDNNWKKIWNNKKVPQIDNFTEFYAFKERSALSGLKVIPSQANYFMIELLNGSVRNVTKRLLTEYNLLVKDLYDKLGGKEYMRIAIRNKEDNDRLVKALQKVLS